MKRRREQENTEEDEQRASAGMEGEQETAGLQRCSELV